MKSVLETINDGTTYLQRQGVESPRLNMEHLLAHVLGCKRLQLYMQYDRPLGEAELAPLREITRRRARREPLQHILGTAEFLGRQFICDSRALIPRPETEELVEKIVSDFKKRGTAPERILDMGTGSGVIGLSLGLAYPSSQCVLADASLEALSLCRENAARLGLGEDRVEFVHTDLFSKLPVRSFNLIAANLPYIPAAEIPALSPEVQLDPHAALDGGTDGHELIARFLKDCPLYLAPGALLALEIGAGQAGKLAALMREFGLQDVATMSDYSERERFLLGRTPS